MGRSFPPRYSVVSLDGAESGSEDDHDEGTELQEEGAYAEEASGGAGRRKRIGRQIATTFWADCLDVTCRMALVACLIGRSIHIWTFARRTEGMEETFEALEERFDAVHNEIVTPIEEEAPILTCAGATTVLLALLLVLGDKR